MGVVTHDHIFQQLRGDWGEATGERKWDALIIYGKVKHQTGLGSIFCDFFVDLTIETKAW
ncbi:hypothetical protein ES705_40650 [subsurface metagenome]